MNKIIFIFCLFFCLFFLTFCNSNTEEFQKMVTLNNAWKYKHAAIFEFKNTNNKPKTISALIRNNDDYEFSNLYLFVHHLYPNGEKKIDTLQYFLADNQGKWLGKGFTQVKQNLLEIKSLKSYSNGIHKIRIFHGMRKKNLIGLEDITLTIK